MTMSRVISCVIILDRGSGAHPGEEKWLIIIKVNNINRKVHIPRTILLHSGVMNNNAPISRHQIDTCIIIIIIIIIILF